METYVVAFDFEAAGGVPSKNGFTQLGASIKILETGEEIASFNEYASMNGYEWDERCVKEFWEKNPERYQETLEKTKMAEKSPYEVVDSFIKWTREFTKDKNAYLITDCSTFDTGILKYFSSVDTMYLLGPCRDIIDVNCVYMGMFMKFSKKYANLELVDGSSKKMALASVNKSNFPEFPVNHDHNPVNDARVIFMKWKFIQDSLNL